LAASRATLPPEIINLADFPTTISVLAYADSGTGKTRFAGTAENALFLAPVKEGGVEAALATAGPRGKVWPIWHWSDLRKAYIWLKANPTAFNWVIIDSLTHLQDVAMADVLVAAHKANPKRDPDIPAQPDYLKVQKQLVKMTVALNELPFHKLYTAGTMREDVPTVDGDIETLVLPMIESREAKLSMRICGQMMVVAYYTVKEVGEKERRRERWLLTQKTGNFFAKDRYDALGTWMKEPDVPTIERKIKDKIAQMREEAA
jgi:hypothetical protein